MSCCPNCRAPVSNDAEACSSCQAIFSADGWLPLDEEPPSRKTGSAAALIAKLGVTSVVVPGVAFTLGLIVSLVIPGCRCDEGSGCHGCGPNALIEFLLFGGFVGALFSLLTILPSALALAGIVGVVGKLRS